MLFVSLVRCGFIVDLIISRQSECYSCALSHKNVLASHSLNDILAHVLTSHYSE